MPTLDFRNKAGIFPSSFFFDLFVPAGQPLHRGIVYGFEVRRGLFQIVVTDIFERIKFLHLVMDIPCIYVSCVKGERFIVNAGHVSLAFVDNLWLSEDIDL